MWYYLQMKTSFVFQVWNFLERVSLDYFLKEISEFEKYLVKN